METICGVNPDSLTQREKQFTNIHINLKNLSTHVLRELCAEKGSIVGIKEIIGEKDKYTFQLKN